MAFMCSLCGGIVYTEQGKDWPYCSLSGEICIGGEVKIQEGFADAISILQDKGYRLIGYNLPRSDDWETGFYISLVFNQHRIPAVVPPGFQVKDLPEANGVVFFRDYDPAEYEKQAEERAEDLLRWADGLPAADDDIVKAMRL